MRKFSLLLFLFALLQVSCADSEGRDNNANNEKEHEQMKGKTSEEKAVFETSSEAIENQLQEGISENTFFQKEDLEKFYSERNYEPAWSKDELRKSLFSALSKAAEEGLAFADYHEKELKKLQQQEMNETASASMDLLLTDAFLQYAHDLYYGRLDPAKVHELWGVKRQQKDLVELLNSGVKNGKIEEAFEELKPNQQVYRDLKTALREYEPQKDQQLKTPKISEGKLIRPGQKDPRISAIFERLKEKDFEVPKMSKNDSLYSEELEGSIKEFQKERGLETDGIIGNSTIKELNMSPADRYQQLLVNLERWRWYPRDLGEHYILINVANFKLAVVKNGDTIREHKVIAGSRSRQTPTFTDTVQYIVINPAWHIPSSIARQEVIPQARTNPDYLRSRNMKVYSGDGQVDPANIDWSSSESRSYRFVQTAGPANPLGRVKIIYPNKYLIYLHDTPAQSLFGQNQRAESHGCVRVQNAVELASYLVEGQDDWTEEKLREVIDSGKTTKVKIHRPIQVHHFYWTAWRDGGKTVFSPDVYDLDKKIYTQLTAN